MRLAYLRLVDKTQDGILSNQINAEEIQEIKDRFGFIRNATEHVNLSLLCEMFPDIHEIKDIYSHREKFRS